MKRESQRTGEQADNHECFDNLIFSNVNNFRAETWFVPRFRMLTEYRIG